MSEHYDAIHEMQLMLNSAKARWMRDTNLIVLNLLQNAHTLENALGDISYDEAIDAWQRMAVSAIDTLRTRKANDEAEKE